MSQSNCHHEMLGDVAARPLACVAIAFACGIGAVAAPHLLWALLALVGLGVGWAAFRSRPALAGVSVLALALAAGAVLAHAHQNPPQSDVSRLPAGGQMIVGTVANAPRYADGWWLFVLLVERHVTGPRAQPVTGRCYVRLRTDKPVRRGDRWRLTGRLRPISDARNPGGPSERVRLSALGVRSVFTVGSPALAEQLGQGRLGWIGRHAFSAQGRALRLLERFVGGPYQGLSANAAASVIFGVHATSPPAEISAAFRRAGTIHLLVVSGAMVSSVFGLVFLPGVLGAGWRRARLERQAGGLAWVRGGILHRPGAWAAAIAVLAATYYAVLTEGGQAVARAAIMGVLVGLSLMLKRIPRLAREHGVNVDPYSLLGIAALAILVVQPEALFQAGFQLSFAAAWALIYFVPKAERFLAPLPRWANQTLVGTFGAQLTTFPILVWHYGNAPVAGLVANLLAIPLAGVVLVAGMLTCAMGVLLPWAAPAPGWVTGCAARGLVWVSGAFASLPWAAPDLARPHPAFMLAWYAALLALGWWLHRRKSSTLEDASPPA